MNQTVSALVCSIADRVRLFGGADSDVILRKHQRQSDQLVVN